MIRRSLNVLVPTLAAAARPWGAIGEIVKGALKNYGYHVLIRPGEQPRPL
jgi:hypothetical protein